MYERVLDRLLPGHRASSRGASPGDGKFDEYIIDEDDYVGVGSGAFSYVGGADVLDHVFAQPLLPARRGRSERHHATSHARLKERMRYDYLCALRGALKREYIAERYGAAFWLRMGPSCLRCAWLARRVTIRRTALTRRGMYCWVLMMAEFFNSVKMCASRCASHPRRARRLERGGARAAGIHRAPDREVRS